ncbi:BTAD domain-containing putative transcriptional regulator [Roseomonas harenae]|uniref:BTAD domain-containing putative transcriptional regulator n=1 Tax=Muricoccus harenae TaxID=2692566 RepID=UPI0013317868|nr:BTAD domain-containing putative transcriptional regulator [Roseomonas harenae]
MRLFGPVRMLDEAGQERPIPTRKARALLGFLLMARGRPVSRARLAALLWERSAEAEARASLRQAMLELSRAFGDVPVIQADRESLRIDPGCCEVDAFAPLAVGETLWSEAAPPPLMDGLDAIGDEFGEWLRAEREAVLARFRTLHETALAELEAQPDGKEAAIAVARSLVALDPAHEPGWRALMRLLAVSGNRGQALSEYARCQEALRHALDVEPSAETRDLATRLRIGTASVVLTPMAPAVERRLRVGVVSGVDDSLATAYACDAALELVRYRHFDVLDPACLGGTREWSPNALRGFGLDYVVNITIRQQDGGSRLLCSLMEVSELSRPVWSERVPLDSNAGSVETEVLARLIARLEPVILHTEGTRPVARHASDASEIVIRAIPLLFSMEGARFRRAGQMLAEAVTLEPENAMAAAWAAQWHVFQIGQSWAPDPGVALEEAERLAVLAMSLDPESAEAAAIYGHVSSYLHKDFDSAAYYLGRSLEMNPHLASAWALSAATHAYSGDPAESLRRLERYRTLAPFHPHDRILSQIFTTAYTLGGEFEKALVFGRRAVRAAPGFVNGYKPVLASLGHLGMQREAKPILASLLKVEPDFNVQGFVSAYPFRRAEDREAYAEGLRLAGAPKG